MNPENQTPDPHNLNRFVEAQQPIYQQARSELTEGHKRTHWMWFIFPQIAGLGSSETARRFAIADIDQAVAYLEHPILGPRLRECTALVNALPGSSADTIFGYPDNLKFHSSITLFDRAAAMREHEDPADRVFNHALRKFFNQAPDHATLKRIDPHRR